MFSQLLGEQHLKLVCHIVEGIRDFVISFHFINSKRSPPACFQFAYSVLHAFDSFWCIGSFFYCLQGFFQRGNFFLTLQNHRNWQEESRGGTELETVLNFKEQKIMKATRLTESVREELGVCVLVTFWLGQDGRAWMFHGGKQCSQTQGLLELDLLWVSSLLVCLGICGAALLVWQCLASLAARFGPSPCQVLAHRLQLDKAAGAVPAGVCVGGHARCPSPSHRLPWRGPASPWPLLHPNHPWKEPGVFFFFSTDIRQCCKVLSEYSFPFSSRLAE